MPSNKGGIYATLKGEPEPDYWSSTESSLIADSNDPDALADYVRGVVAAKAPRGSLEY